MGEQKHIEKNSMPQHPPWTINNITCRYEGEHALKNVGKNGISCNTKSNIKKKRKSTQMDQRTQKIKWALQQSSKTLPKEGPS